MTLAPEDWMPNARLDRVILHWTAGTLYGAAFVMLQIPGGAYPGISGKTYRGNLTYETTT